MSCLAQAPAYFVVDITFAWNKIKQSPYIRYLVSVDSNDCIEVKQVDTELMSSQHQIDVVI